MRTLGEQWIENGRMYKAISGKFNCLGCSLDNGSVMCIHKNIVECGEGQNFIIHDLGPVNEEGCLACPFCGAFPIVRCIEEQEGECIVAQAFCPKGDLEIQEPEGKGHVLWFMRTTLQQAIDAWNRRA